MKQPFMRIRELKWTRMRLLRRPRSTKFALILTPSSLYSFFFFIPSLFNNDFRCISFVVLLDVGCIATGTTRMYSFTQVFFSCMSLTIGANLTTVIFIYLGKINATLPANIGKNIEKLPVLSITLED